MKTELLYDILTIESESHDSTQMEQFLTDYATAQGWQIEPDRLGNLYVTKGNASVYPCLVAHMDTVHSITGEGISIVEIAGKVTGMYASTMQQTGIGGDDKCGIYCALYVLGALPAGKAVFFVDEEVGCLGSSAANMDFFEDCAFILQADRRGGSDFVTSIGGRPLASDEWLEAIRPQMLAYGFKPVAGMMTDVEALRDAGVGICAANMSAGYYNPHQDGEYIDLNELDNVAEMMLDICERYGSERWEYTPPEKVRYTSPAWQVSTSAYSTSYSSPRRPRGMPRTVWRDLREEAQYREARQQQLAEAFPYDVEEIEPSLRELMRLESET